MIRRQSVGALSVAVLVLLAGCVAGAVEFGSSPATVAPDALADAGYAVEREAPTPVSSPVVLGPFVADVSVTGYAGVYTKTVGEDTAALVVLSTPNRKVLGQSVNPLAHLSNRELVGWTLNQVGRLGALGEFEGVRSLQHVGAEERTVLGERVDVLEYAGTVDTGGERRDVVVHLVAVEHGSDVILAVGVHERSFDESAALVGLIERVEHVEAVEDGV